MRRSLCLASVLAMACAVPMSTSDPSLLQVSGIDVDQTLQVVRDHLERSDRARSIALWSLRDQRIEPAHARTISALYFCHIDRMESEFDLWHFTWAIANLYRNNGPEVRRELELAYCDAGRRAAKSRDIADRMVNGERYYGGDFHFLGRAARRRHLVVPGNRRYLQSPAEHTHGSDEMHPTLAPSANEACAAVDI